MQRQPLHEWEPTANGVKDEVERLQSGHLLKPLSLVVYHIICTQCLGPKEEYIMQRAGA